MVYSALVYDYGVDGWYYNQSISLRLMYSAYGYYPSRYTGNGSAVTIDERKNPLVLYLILVYSTQL